MMFQYLFFFTLFSTYKCDARDIEKILEQKTQRLMDLTENKAVLDLDEDTFEEFVKSSPRNYSIIVLFPAEPLNNIILNNYLYTEFSYVATAVQTSKFFYGKMFFASAIYGVMRPPIYKVYENALYIAHYPAYGEPGYKDFMISTVPNSISRAMFSFVESKSKIKLPNLNQSEDPTPTSSLTDLKVLSLAAVLILHFWYAYLNCERPDFWKRKQTWLVLGTSFCYILYTAFTFDPQNVQFLMNVGLVLFSITILYLFFILFMHFFINPYSYYF